MKSYKDLKEYLIKNNIKVYSLIEDSKSILKISSLSNAKKDEITFFNNEKLIHLLKKTKASYCIIEEKFVKFLPKTSQAIIVQDPYLAYAYASNFFSNENEDFENDFSKIYVSPNCKIDKNVKIDNFVCIKENTIIENEVSIGSNTTIGPNVKISRGTKIQNNCTILHSNIGKNSIIQSGSIIGGSGFGFQKNQKVDIIHLGNVDIKDNVNIGSNVTIDRASLDSTIIGNNVRIDNLVQIAHNVMIGDNTVIAAQCGIAGSTEIGSNCTIGGQAGITGHIKIGNNVTIAAKSGVTKNIEDNSVVAGFPAIDINKWRRLIVTLNKSL